MVSLPKVNSCAAPAAGPAPTCVASNLPLIPPLPAAPVQLLYDGTDAAAVELLSRIRHVRLMHLRPPFASAEERTKFEFYAQQAQQWGGQPGNYELMVKQGGLLGGRCACPFER